MSEATGRQKKSWKSGVLASVIRPLKMGCPFASLGTLIVRIWKLDTLSWILWPLDFKFILLLGSVRCYGMDTCHTVWCMWCVRFCKITNYKLVAERQLKFNASSWNRIVSKYHYYINCITSNTLTVSAGAVLRGGFGGSSPPFFDDIGAC